MKAHTKIALFLSVLLVLVSLAACSSGSDGNAPAPAPAGSDAGGDAPESKAAPAGETGGWEDKGNQTVKVLSFGGLEAYPMLAEKFYEDSGIKVEYSTVPFADLHTQAATMFAAQSSDVDIISTWTGWTAEFAEAGFLEDITDRLPAELKDDIVPLSLDSVTYKGQFYGVPRFYSINLLFYNKAMFREAGLDPDTPPKDIDAWKDALQKLTMDTDGDGANDTHGLMLSFQNQYMTSAYFEGFLAWQGLPVVDDDDNLLINTEEGRNALELMRWFQDEGVLDPATFSSEDGMSEQSKFVLGNVGYIISYSNTLAYAEDPEKSRIVGELGWSTNPVWNGTSGTVMGSEGYAITSFSQNKANALKWLEYIALPENQAFMTATDKWMPMRASVLSDPEVMKVVPHAPAFAEQAKGFGARCSKPYWSEVQESIGQYFIDCINGSLTVEDALNQAEAKANEIIANYKNG